jgi:hypothetical protein
MEHLFCEMCNNKHSGSYGSGRFCSQSCANKFASNLKREEVNKKVSERMRNKIDDGSLGRFQKGNKTGGNRKGWKSPFKKKLEEVMVENSTMRTVNVRRKILEEGVLEYRCKICGVKDWLGKELTLQLDHINGNNRDHRKENLRFLCPNCHSQTETWGNKGNTGNKKKYSL